MASILRVNTITDASSNNSIATSVVFNGVNKVWLRKAADGASIPDSYNVSSVDDDGTGQIGVNISSAMSNALYSITTSIMPSGNTTVIGTCEINEFSTITTSAFDAETAYANSSNNRTDFDYAAGIAVQGDLA
jgi:hypothetical protein